MKCADTLVRHAHQNGVYLAAVAGVEHLDLLSDRGCRCQHLGRGCIGKGIVRINEQAEELGVRQQLTDQSEPLFR
jgi:hypothetical protein